MVSVIMPFLDPPESFFHEAIASVERQTYTNWELILVDDGSSGDTTRIAKTSAERLPGKISYTEHAGHQNLGISASRNLGISSARGEYIAFLDADDVWDHQQLQEQVELLEQHQDASMLYGNTMYWYSWEHNPSSTGEDVTYDLGVPTDRVMNPPEFLRKILARRALPPCMTAIIVRRQVFDDGIDFEASFPRHYEDQVFVAKVALERAIYVSSSTWGKYRQHGGSVTSDGDESNQALAWRLKYLRWMAAYVDMSGFDDREIRFLIWLETGVLESRFIDLAARFYRLWRGRFRRLFARLRGH